MHGILAVTIDVSAGVQAPSIYAVISREAVQSIVSLFFLPADTHRSHWWCMCNWRTTH